MVEYSGALRLFEPIKPEELPDFKLRRKVDEGIVIDHSIVVRILDIDTDRGRVKFGIIAPENLTVLCKEVTESEEEVKKFLESYNRRKEAKLSRTEEQTPGMLIITRKPGQSLLFGPRICFKVVDIIDGYNQVKISVQAPGSVSVNKQEDESLAVRTEA